MGNLKKQNKAVKAGIGYVIGNYLLKGLSFFSIPIFSRLLSTSDYGTYNTFIAYESILFVLVGLAIHSSFKNAKYKYKDNYNKYISSSILLVIFNLILFLLVLNIILKFNIINFQFNNLLLNLLIIYSFCSAIIQCYNVYLGLDYSYQPFLRISFINALSNILLSVLLIVFVFKTEKYIGRIFGTVIPSIFITIYIIFKFFKQAKPSLNKDYWKWGLNYSLPIVPHGISQVVLNQFDRIMINSMVSAASAGIYSFAYNIFSIINVTSNSLTTAWEPYFYEKMHNKEYTSIKKRSSLFIVLILLFSVGVMLVSPEVILLLGSSKYSMSIYSVLPIICGGFYAFLYNIPAEVEYYFAKTKIIALATSMAALINIILNYIFILKYGYIAAAYTTLFTYLLYFLFHFYLSKRICNIKLFNDKLIYISLITIFVFNFFTLLVLNYIALRWLLAFLVFLSAVYVEEKELKLLTKRLKKEHDDQ